MYLKSLFPEKSMAEKAIRDITNILKCLLADGNIPTNIWELVGEHATQRE